MKLHRKLINIGSKFCVVLALAAWMAWLGIETSAATNTPPSVTALSVSTPPLIDGVLTDACWQTAAPIKSFVLVKTVANTVPQNVWVAHDAAWLYLAFEVPHPVPREIRQAVRKTNGPVNTDDSVEIFLDPGTDGAVYFHSMLNAGNVRSSKSVAKDVKNYVTIYMCNLWQSAAKVTTNGWNAEIAIPLALLARSGDLTRLRMNLTRNLVIPTIDASHVRVDETVQNSSWAPVFISFHEPDRFGYVRGLPAKPQAAFCPRFESLQVTPYERAGGRINYGVKAVISDPFRQTGSAKLVVSDYPVKGGGGEVSTALTITNIVPQTVTVSMPAADMSRRTIRVELRDVRTGGALQSEWLEGDDVKALETLSVYPDRSHYSSETQAVIACIANVPAADYAALQLVARTAEGHPLGSRPLAGQETALAIPVSALAPGMNAIIVELAQTNGVVLAAQLVSLIRKEAVPSVEWKTDRQNGVLLRNGQPFFPFGLICVVGFDSVTNREPVIREIAEAGFNAICQFDFSGTPEQTRSLLALAERYGLAWIDNLDAYHAPKAPSLLNLRGKVLHMPLAKAARQAVFDEGYRSNLPYIVEGINAGKTNPALTGYFTLDEPSSGDSVDMYRWGRDLYRQTQTADGTHPTFLNFSSYIPPGDEWIDWCDVLMTDPYWWPAGKAHRGTPNYVSKITWLTVERGRQIRKPVMIIPMAETWGSNPKRQITPEEQYCQTYLALIHGAKGIFYFCYPLYHQVVFQALSELAGQIKQLMPALLAPPVNASITYSPEAGDPAQGSFPDVQVRLCREPKGDYLLLAANSRGYPVEATYRITGLKNRGAVRQMFASAKCPVSDGSFKELLPPYATRVYQLESLATGPATPIPVTVTLAGHPEQAIVEEPAIMYEGRTGRKNILPNPGFEQATLPGKPDYVWPFRLASPTLRWGMTNYPMALDTVNPYEGKVSLRISTAGSRQGVHLKLAPKVERPEPYVFSAYMRGDSNDARVDMPTVGWGWTSPRICLTTNWQRYVISGNMPPGLGDNHNNGVRFFAVKGTVWIDAMQLEKGTEATKYEP